MFENIFLPNARQRQNYSWRSTVVDTRQWHTLIILYRVFDRATQASGIVLMKPFPSQTPSLFPFFPVSAMMQREKNFRLMAQIMKLPRRKDHHVWPKRYSGGEESEKGRDNVSNWWQFRKNVKFFHYLRHWISPSPV